MAPGMTEEYGRDILPKPIDGWIGHLALRRHDTDLRCSHD